MCESIDLIMLNNPSISLFKSYVWIPIKRNRYPSTITWHQIERQRRNDGKAIRDDDDDEEGRTASQHFFNYRLSMASSLVLFFEYCLSMYRLAMLKSLE